MLVKAVFRLLYPKRCPYCRDIIDDYLPACENCLSQLPEKPLEFRVQGGFPCVASAFYEDKFKDAVIAFKFSGKKQYGESLAYSVANAVKAAYDGVGFDCVTCVPMFKRRQKRRGYNQAEVIALETAELLGAEYVPLLVKIKDNSCQHNLKRSEREKNVRGVYAVSDKALIKDKNILICDDIVTTGCTLGECCRILDKAGAKSIYCAAFAKAK